VKRNYNWKKLDFQSSNQSINAPFVILIIVWSHWPYYFCLLYITCENARRISTNQCIFIILALSSHLLTENHLDQSLRWTNQKHWEPVRSNLLHSFFLHVHSSDAPFSIHCKLCGYAEPKPGSWAKQACFHFCSSNFTSLGPHIEHPWRCCNM